MDTVRFYDTCSLLDLQERAFEEYFWCSSITLQEVERIKTAKNKTEDLRYKARNLVRLLKEHQGEYGVVIYDMDLAEDLLEYKVDNTPDAQICMCAIFAERMLRDRGYKMVFVTNDLCCGLIAKNVFGLDVEEAGPYQDKIYKGYKIIHGSAADINLAMENIDYNDWYTNEYLIIENTDDGTTKEMRFDGTQFVALKLPPSKYIKAKNSLQRCALDMLMNPNISICAVLGGYGSGKTKLSLAMALYHVLEKGNQSKVLVVREQRGEGEEIGFLPGEMEAKIQPMTLPIAQQLDGGEFELESLKQRGVIESNIPYFMKGTTYNDTIIVVDEAEDLTEKQIRLIGTRVGEGGRIFLDGDYKQSVVNATEDNALVKMVGTFKGDSKFGVIYLQEDVRSTTSKMFANLFE